MNSFSYMARIECVVIDDRGGEIERLKSIENKEFPRVGVIRVINLALGFLFSRQGKIYQKPIVEWTRLSLGELRRASKKNNVL